MASFGDLNPLRIAKRKIQAYSEVPSRDSSEDLDLEKRSSIDSSDYSSPSQSRAVSSSYPAGSWGPSSPGRKLSGAAAYAYRAPKKYGRYFTLALGSTIIIFILALTRASWASSANVALGTGLFGRLGPAPWEAFPFLKRYYGGIRTLVPRDENVPEYPGDAFNASDYAVAAKAAAEVESEEGETNDKERRDGIPKGVRFSPYPDYSAEYASVQQCYLDDTKKTKVPSLLAYNGITRGMPEPVFGSYELLKLRNDVCFDRFGRLGPYGLGYSRKSGGSGAGMEGDREGADQVWEEDEEVDYRDVRWADVQDRCSEKNRLRFKSKPKGRNNFYQIMPARGPNEQPPQLKSAELIGSLFPIETRDDDEPPTPKLQDTPKPQDGPLVPNERKLLPRTALIIRTWWDYQYDDEDIMYLRSLIAELSIGSGGEYTVHFLIHVKDDNVQIWADDEVYQRVLTDSLPEEFRGMGTLWSERQMGLIYGGVDESFYRDLPVHGAYRSTYMPVQYFAHQHPEYDFFWHWEMDARYTGHYYHLFDSVSNWARNQPRKGLWERNSRFYIPSEHGSWEDFKHMVRVQTEHGTSSTHNLWASMAEKDPKLPEYLKPSAQKPEKPIWGPEPPLDDKLDTSDDPEPASPLREDDYEWGVGEDADLITFNPLFDPQGTNWILANDITGYNTTRTKPPRRAAIITASRLSHRLLETMHRETALGRHTMFSEMWPGSCALHHGYKAVYAPHPVFIDRRWPTDYLAATFNAGRNGASGGARTAVFSDERQHNFLGTTWYYDAGHAVNVWKRWLGYRVDGNGGEQEEVAKEGRMCLPAMLLHPVKQVDLIYEHAEGE